MAGTLSIQHCLPPSPAKQIVTCRSCAETKPGLLLPVTTNSLGAFPTPPPHTTFLPVVPLLSHKAAVGKQRITGKCVPRADNVCQPASYNTRSFGKRQGFLWRPSTLHYQPKLLEKVPYPEGVWAVCHGQHWLEMWWKFIPLTVFKIASSPWNPTWIYLVEQLILEQNYLRESGRSMKSSCAHCNSLAPDASHSSGPFIWAIALQLGWHLPSHDGDFPLISLWWKTCSGTWDHVSL